jgi:hypothetical protein
MTVDGALTADRLVHVAEDHNPSIGRDCREDAKSRLDRFLAPLEIITQEHGASSVPITWSRARPSSSATATAASIG